jgi:hypothetical protein
MGEQGEMGSHRKKKMATKQKLVLRVMAKA